MASAKVTDVYVADLKKRGVSVIAKTYPGTTHGFGCRADLSRPEIKEAYEGALEQCVEVMKKELK